MTETSLATRMKENYEDRYRFKLTRRTPVIMRLDGKSFHTVTKGCKKPFDKDFIASMLSTACNVLKNIDGAKLAYVQSDEISILITDYDKLETDAWFDYNIQKMTSVSASIASVTFTQMFKRIGYFDSRVFNIPVEEVSNYFIWRYKDWVKNSVQMYARSEYSYKDLHKKNRDNMHEMLFKKGKNWNNLNPTFKNGTLIIKNMKDTKLKGDSISFISPKSVDELRELIEIKLNKEEK